MSWFRELLPVSISVNGTLWAATELTDVIRNRTIGIAASICASNIKLSKINRLKGF
jgi:hypothetical protein